MTDKQLAILLQNMAARLQAEADAIHAELSEVPMGAIKRSLAVSYIGPELPIGSFREQIAAGADPANYATKEVDSFPVLTGLYDFINELEEQIVDLRRAADEAA